MKNKKVDKKVELRKESEYNMGLLRGWQRSQLALLKQFAVIDIMNQTAMSFASGVRAGTSVMGGKMTALTRSKLIVKAGKDDDNKMQWQLNEEKLDRKKLLEFLDKLSV